MRKIRKGLKIFRTYPIVICLCVGYIYICMNFFVKTTPEHRITHNQMTVITYFTDKGVDGETRAKTTKEDKQTDIRNIPKCNMSSYIAYGSGLCLTVLSKRKISLPSDVIMGKTLKLSQQKIMKTKAGSRNHRNDYLLSREENCSIDKVVQHCHTLRESYIYGKHNTSTEEKLYPLAFAMKIHTYGNQAHRLLRYIYHQHNIYCIHIDGKADIEIYKRFKLIESCFDNIIVIEDRVRVVYSTIRVVEAELKCMKALSGSTTKWKYYINLTGQEFMLKTNAELLKILKAMNGTNDIESYPVPFTEYHKFKQRTFIINENPIITRQKKQGFRQNIKIHKGSAYGMFSREFVNFILNDNFVKDFLIWLGDTYAPEELIWATLQVLPGTPGGRSNSVSTKDIYISRAVKWQMDQTVTCHGKYVHWICIYGLEDLPWLLSHRNIVANKFYEDFDPLALYCVENIMYLRLMHGK
ncbi:N-acetyllactosaminide beta-1,6-N-acetylglucosaminyl-transferase-like [Ruditapes philippinarum]|uniref:N-acetyllactosaminide beta-1,6-N-acetylglucosaminyl-transferase-like n=1 Tax=Ruditapes philippinarum TaxID=129788 RepID=UPI00295B2554|nr:N-acetyllactosaminide beta-1,6-N-acetylglucosaminyl-transferase-like [Ruditapes philippinarum]